jgi:quercetin 2,3-dioxygenase
VDAARAVTIDVRRGADRFVTRREGIELRHSFSFGEHYDATNVSFGLLLASNEMLLAPGAGFDPHEHRDIEIVTWVVTGALEHADSSGAGGVIVPGMAQRLSTGRAVEHSERASASSPTQVVQMWVAPDAHGFEPSYEQRDFSAELEAGELVVVASGDPQHESALRIHQRGVTLSVARLAAGASIELPASAYLHVYVTTGTVKLPDGTTLDAGDAARVTDSGLRLESADSAEILAWTMAP